MSKVGDLINYGLTEVGKPYVFGDEGPNEFDCSGLMQFIFAHIGVKLPRTADEQFHFAKPISSPSPGDLVFYVDGTGRATHVVLYLGGGKVLQAPHPGAKVDVTNLFEISGHTRHYGRISGVGGTVASVGSAVLGTTAAAVADPLSSLSGSLDSILGGAKQIVIEGLFGLVGLGLVGGGIYLLASPKMKAKRQQIEGML